jgi:hypothetical protein
MSTTKAKRDILPAKDSMLNIPEHSVTAQMKLLYTFMKKSGGLL